MKLHYFVRSLAHSLLINLKVPDYWFNVKFKIKAILKINLKLI